MRRLTLTLLALFVLAPFALSQKPASDPPAANLTGKWTATWLVSGKESGTRNTIHLTDASGAISGSFVADSGESCPVEGSLTNGNVVLHVSCAKFAIELLGQLQGLEINGSFLAYENSRGEFRMEKSICMLPEGCGNH